MLSTKIIQLEQKLVEDINNSDLNMTIVDLLLQKILKQVEAASQQSLLLEAKQIKEAKEQETTEDTKE